MSSYVRHYCGTCGAQLRYRKADYEHANGTVTCAEVRPIVTEIDGVRTSLRLVPSEPFS